MARMRLFFGKLLDLGEPEQLHDRGARRWRNGREGLLSGLLRYVLRVTSGGRFVAPPAKAECMYAPDVFGRTGASVVDAKP